MPKTRKGGNDKTQARWLEKLKKRSGTKTYEECRKYIIAALPKGQSGNLALTPAKMANYMRGVTPIKKPLNEALATLFPNEPHSATEAELDRERPPPFYNRPLSEQELRDILLKVRGRYLC